jgi:hypothetical protein
VGFEIPEFCDDLEAVVDGLGAATALPQYLPVFESGDDVFDAGPGDWAACGSVNATIQAIEVDVEAQCSVAAAAYVAPAQLPPTSVIGSMIGSQTGS